MARVTGLEPATSGVTGRRSNQLSYTRIPMRAEEFPSRQKSRGIMEPPYSVKRGSVSEHRRRLRRGFGVSREMVGGERLELPTLSV